MFPTHQHDPSPLHSVDANIAPTPVRHKESEHQRVFQSLPDSLQHHNDPSPVATSYLSIDSVTFHTHGRQPVIVPSHRIRNIPIFAIAFLDIANSGDFAANVFNEIPVPVYATILMVLGATCALVMSYFAFKDARQSWKNIKLLRQERQTLLAQDEECASSSQSYRVELDLNHRDLWTEFFDRFAMEVLMGIAAFIIAVGTYMAPAGANRRVFRASNLLSGYIGNAPAAGYGLVTSAWSIHVLMRAHRQRRAAMTGLVPGSVRQSFLARVTTVSKHATLTAVTCLVSGVLSMFTPTHWWPYPVLAVCGLAFIYATYLYRTQIGYLRPQLIAGVRIEKDLIVRELEFIAWVRQVLKIKGAEKSAVDDASLASLLQLVVRCDLFENFANCLIQDDHLRQSLMVVDAEEIRITTRLLFGLPAEQHDQIRRVAQKCLEEQGLQQISYRRRFLLEALGSALTVPLYDEHCREWTNKKCAK